MPDIDVYKIEEEELNEEEFVPCTVEKYDIHLENYVEEYFKDLKGLPLGLSKKVLVFIPFIIIPPTAAMPWIIAKAGIALLFLIPSPDVTSPCSVIFNLFCKSAGKV